MTKDAAQTKGSGLSVAGWPLRRKIALALAIPLLLAATLGALRVQGDLADSTSAGRSAEQVTIIKPAVDYLTASETAMVAAQTDSAAAQGDLIDAIDDIVASAETLTQARDNAELNELQTAHVDALLDLSQAMRGDEAQNLGPATWIALVRQLESSVSQLVTSVNAASSTPQPRLEQLSQAMSGRLSLAMQQGLVANTELAQSGSQELFSEIGVEASAIDRLAGSVEGAEALTAELRTANTRHASQIRDDSATNLDGRDAYQPYDEITDTLITGVTASLTDAAGEARNRALLGAFLTLAALAAAIALAIAVARSLLEPIGKVREGALAVARHRLPDAVARIRAGEEPEPIKPIDVTTNEEIGQVARAVDDLHRQAIHLASGEAQLRQTVNAMFVTLSRRSNSLVNQQLAQIERLEHDEEDPKRLESLFRLDHLASRMRRTADSLLILADAPSRDAGSFSLTVGEALQAATSGVQNYQRVQILSHLGTRISDAAAPDVVHLLTELVDNALNFSPPTEPVRLAAKLGADGATITVTDAGLGVPAAELDLLNRDLAHGAEATPDTARRMGLFVVSRLAERHGVVASLVRNPGGGMTASVLLPPSVLPELPQTVAPASAQSVTGTTSGGGSSSAAPVAAAASTEVLEKATKTDSEPAKRRGLGRGRSEKADAKAAENAAAAEAKATEKTAAAEAKAADKAAEEAAAAEATQPVAPVDPAAAATTSEPTPGRPSLESLLPRREPGANIPRTGADAFLLPTSGETGPLFAKRAPAAAPGSVKPAASVDEPAAEGVDESLEQTSDPAVVEQVASVVSITALASRQRAQAKEARASEELARATSEEPVAEPVAEEPVEAPVAATRPDPLTDPLPAENFDDEPGEVEPEPEAAAEPEPEAAAEPDDVPVDLDDPLGLDRPAARAEVAPEPEPTPVPALEIETPAPAAAEAAPEAPAAYAGGGLAGRLAGGLGGGLPTRTRGASAEINRDMPGLVPTNGDSGRVNGDSPIFKSIRSGWLAGDEGEFHETEIDRGWEIAEHVAEEAPVVEGHTPIGLPRRAPGERLIPGSVTPPEPAKARDPEAIRRRLQAHTAGVSRGRRAAQSPSQHTEAGPA